MVKLLKIKKNRQTNEETHEIFMFKPEEVACLYKDRNGTCFIFMKSGYHNQVPYDISELKDILEL